MITKEKYSRSQRYLINETALSFTENYQGVNKHGNPIYDVVYVSIVSNAAIMVFDPNNGIEYGDDLQYQRWRLSGATTGLVSSDAHNIYARLNKQGSKEATIIFSVRNYNTDGSITKLDADGNPAKDEEGNTLYELEASDTYWYIPIGTLTELSDTGRTLTFDPGNLSTQYQQNEQGGGWVAEMFELVRDAESLIRAKLRFEKLQVKGESLFDSIANFYKGIKIGPNDSAKAITSVATDLSTSEDATDAAATPAYVKAFSEGRYLSKISTDPQSVAGPVTFEQDVTVEGDHDVNGNQTIQGNQEVKGLQTLHEGFKTAGFSNAAGQITGAYLTKQGLLSVSGIIANSFEIQELIYNVIRAQGGKASYSDVANIEKCEYAISHDGGISISEIITPDKFYESNYQYEDIAHVLLTIKKEDHNKGMIPFESGDILYGHVNSIGGSGQYAVGGECCMYVKSSNEEIGEANNGDMTIVAELFPRANAGQMTVVGNIPPIDGMTIAHRGNVRPYDENGNPIATHRLNSFFIDSEQGNIVMLQNVTTPTIDVSYYGVVIGPLPSDLYNKVKAIFENLQNTDTVAYAKYGVFQNIIELDHFGNPVPRERYRGIWDEKIAKGEVEGEEQYRSTGVISHTATYNGAIWRCIEDKVTTAPNIGGWIEVVSAPPQYELKPSVNVIYYRTATGQLSVNKITVTVGETSSKGYTEIVNQGMLDERGLTVYYTITDESGESDRTKLSIAQADALGTEDGGVFITEDGAILILEGEGVSVLDTYERITFYLYDNDGKERASYIVPIMKDGKGVTVDEENTKTRYTKSANGTSHPSISENIWSDDVPAVEQGMFLWTWTHVVYSDGTSTDMFSVSYQGVNGGGVIDADVDYCASEKPLTEEQLKKAEFSENYPSDTPDGWWIYVRTTTYYDNNGTEFSTVSYSGNQVGVGSYYSGLQEYYATGENNITPPSGYPREGVDGAYSDGKAEYFPKNTPMQITGSWSKTRQTMTGGGNSKYLWNFSVSYDSQGNAYVTAPITIANFSKGIFTIQELYAISKYSKPDSGGKHPSDIKSWVDEQQDAAPTTDKPYQWNKTVTTYNDGTAEEFYHVSAVKGEQGPQGEQGKKGDDGINYMIEVNPLTVQIPVDPDTGNTINSSTAIISFRLLVNGKPLEDMSGYTLSVSRDTNGTAVAIKRYSKSDGVIELTLNKNQGVEQRVNQLKIQLLKDGVLVTGTVSFNYIQRGMVGRTGDAGPMPVMSGWYDKTLPYKLFYNSDGRCTGTPIVQNKADDRLYMLVKDIPTDDSGNVRIDDDGNPVDENGRRVDLTNSKYWDMAQYNAFLQAAILFANFASFGGKNGGVFYDRYLFSQNGVDSQGEPSGWSDHADEMFDKNGDFTNVFTPNLRLNFLTGELYGKNAYIEGVVNARGGVFKNISTPNNNFVINEDGTIKAVGGQFTDGNIVLGDGNILMKADGSGYLSKGTISFENDGSGSIGNGMFLWDNNGNLCQKRNVEELYVNVSEMGSKDKYTKLQYSTFTKGGYRLNLNDGDRFDLYRSTNDPDFVVLPSSVSIATAPEGFVSHGIIKITVYIPFTTRASSYFEVLSWHDSKIYIKERDGRTYKYTEIGAGETVAIPYNTPCTFVYSTIVKDDVYVTAWVADF